MAEEEIYDDHYDVDDDDDSSGTLDARGDFADGSSANGMGRGDPGFEQKYNDVVRERDQLRERTRMLDDFERDPETVIKNVANRMGLDLVPRNGRQQSQSQTPNGQPSREFIDRISQSLPPEMEFLAEGLANGMWAANQEALRPLQEQQASERMRSRTQERDSIVADMDTKYPGWRDVLGEMEQIYQFMRESDTGSMKHPKYGSLQELLYKLVTGDNRQATRNAVNRMRSAPGNRTSLSDGGQDTGADFRQMLSKEKDRSRKFSMAFRQALSEHGVR
jgi:hypothetical protein